MSETARMIIRDPSTFHLLTTDMKEQIIKAAINTVNMEAALTRREAVANIGRNFTLRNTWTARQIQYTQMPQGRYALSAIHATVGVTEAAGYMERQEVGGVHRAPGGMPLAIPTDAARGGIKSAPVSKALYLKKIKSKIIRARGYLSSGHKARIAAMAAEAAKKGGFIQINKKIFKVEGFTRRGNGSSFRLRQYYSKNRKTTQTKAQPWMQPAYEKVAGDVENIFISQMKKLGM